MTNCTRDAQVYRGVGLGYNCQFTENARYVSTSGGAVERYQHAADRVSLRNLSYMENSICSIIVLLFPTFFAIGEMDRRRLYS